MIETIAEIAEQCDGIRCDMAMLVLNDIFERTWGARAGARPADDYWTTVIPGDQGEHPEFKFIAEAYWDLEWELQQQGFDFCYDKKLYDRMEHGDAESVRLHLLADLAYQEQHGPVHREPRRAQGRGGVSRRQGSRGGGGDPHAPRGQAAARGTVRGLAREAAGLPGPPPGGAGRSRSRGLLRRACCKATNRDVFRNGDWRLCERSGWPDNQSCQNVLAWCWVKDDERALVVVNFGPAPAQARVHVPWDELGSTTWRLDDALSGDSYDRGGIEMRDIGLYVDLGPWQCHLFALRGTKDQDRPGAFR